MRPNLHPFLVNGRFGDPALFVEILHRRDALLFDLGDLSPLSARDLLRVSHVFVSHMHVDHFIGFDALLRVNLGREKRIRMFGPPGLQQRTFHKLQAYTWDLTERYATDLIFDVWEFDGSGSSQAVRFRFKNRFEAEPQGEALEAEDGLLWTDPDFDVKTRMLEHHGPCLGFAVSERAHVNVWKNRLEERGLPTGQWLKTLKQAVMGGLPDSASIDLPNGCSVPLGDVRDLVTTAPGQKIAYVTDVADTARNRSLIQALAADADVLFIESRFARADEAQARGRAHLTTSAAGEIARHSRARKVEPFHFSPRYEGEEEWLLSEVAAAFAGGRGEAETELERVKGIEPSS